VWVPNSRPSFRKRVLKISSRSLGKRSKSSPQRVMTFCVAAAWLRVAPGGSAQLRGTASGRGPGSLASGEPKRASGTLQEPQGSCRSSSEQRSASFRKIWFFGPGRCLVAPKEPEIASCHESWKDAWSLELGARASELWARRSGLGARGSGLEAWGSELGLGLGAWGSELGKRRRRKERDERSGGGERGGRRKRKKSCFPGWPGFGCNR
jgi:hypothetical protein